MQDVVAEAVNRADARLFQVSDRVLQPRATLGVGRLRPLVLEPGAQPQLELAGRLLGERQRGDRLHGAAPLGQHLHQARDQLAGLAGASGGLDDQRLVEGCADTLALGSVDEWFHDNSQVRGVYRCLVVGAALNIGQLVVEAPNDLVSIALKFSRYFEAIRLRQDRAMIRLEWIQRVVQHPVREQIQMDGRIRRWAPIEEMNGGYLRVVLL